MIALGWPHALIAFVAIERLAELIHSRRNTQALLRRGGRETGARHYPLFIALHGCWLIALAVSAPSSLAPSWPLLVAFAILQALRLWVIVSLGPFWTTRVITLGHEPPVRKGPYRYFKHPNYLVVALEIPVLSLAVGVPWVALAFGVLNVALLLYRIKIEDAARRGIAPANR